MKAILLSFTILCFASGVQAQKSPISYSTGIEISFLNFENSIKFPNETIDPIFNSIKTKKLNGASQKTYVTQSDEPAGFKKANYGEAPINFSYKARKTKQIDLTGLPEMLYFLAQ